jgi:hypothetical protein
MLFAPFCSCHWSAFVFSLHLLIRHHSCLFNEWIRIAGFPMCNYVLYYWFLVTFVQIKGCVAFFIGHVNLSVVSFTCFKSTNTPPPNDFSTPGLDFRLLFVVYNTHGLHLQYSCLIFFYYFISQLPLIMFISPYYLD